MTLELDRSVMASCRECSEDRRLATRRTALFLQGQMRTFSVSVQSALICCTGSRNLGNPLIIVKPMTIGCKNEINSAKLKYEELLAGIILE